MSTEVQKNESTKSAAKKGAVLGFRIALLGIVASVFYITTLPELPSCDSPSAMKLASEELNDNRLVLAAGVQVTAMESPKQVSLSDNGTVRTCEAVMKVTSGSKMPVVYQMVWVDEENERYLVTADLNN